MPSMRRSDQVSMTKAERRLLLLVAQVTLDALMGRLASLKEQSRLTINKLPDPGIDHAMKLYNGICGELKAGIERVKNGH